MKKIIITGVLSFIAFTSLDAQIKIQTPTQSNILDENPFMDASIYVKFPNNIGKGLYFPQVDLTEWTFKTNRISRSTFSTAFDGMVVYNTVSGFIGGDNPSSHDPSTMGKRVSVEPGFYYFYNPNGKTSRNVTQGEWKPLGSATGGEDKFWTLNGNGSTTPVTLKGDNTEGVNKYTITAGNFLGTTDSQSLTVGTNNIARLNIGALPQEDVGGTDFDFVLKVYGKAKFDDGIVTKASTYPDYVFDNYFTGKSDENPNYEFKKLNEVEKFIKENNHLPGVTSIKELNKSEKGYSIDNTQLSIQTLEKVEELYLHVIEQQKEIQALKAEIAELKK